MPIVEPEVLMDGDHDIDRCFDGHRTGCSRRRSRSFTSSKVALEGMVLKPNMVIAGKKSAKQASRARKSPRRPCACSRTACRRAVPGIAFLSGGQSDEEATAHLDAMNKIGGLPWQLTFSYGRALQARRAEDLARQDRRTSPPPSAPSRTARA